MRASETLTNPTLKPTPADRTLDDVLAAVHQLRETLASPPAELLGRDEFARTLAIGVSTFDKLNAAGMVGPKSFRVGGAIRWHRAEVTLYLLHRDHRGELHGAETWGPVWQAIKNRAAVGR